MDVNTSRFLANMYAVRKTCQGIDNDIMFAEQFHIENIKISKRDAEKMQKFYNSLNLLIFDCLPDFESIVKNGDWIGDE